MASLPYKAAHLELMPHAVKCTTLWLQSLMSLLRSPDANSCTRIATGPLILTTTKIEGTLVMEMSATFARSCSYKY